MNASSKDILFACISHHTHPDNKGEPSEHTYDMNWFCECGQCYSCFHAKEINRTIEQKKECVRVICTQCDNPEFHFRERILYQYCFFCSRIGSIICKSCGESY